MSEDDTNEIEGHDEFVLRRLASLCHNRRTTLEEVSQATDASPRRARSWLARLKRLGLVESEGAAKDKTYFPTTKGWELIEDRHQNDSLEEWERKRQEERERSKRAAEIMKEFGTELSMNMERFVKEELPGYLERFDGKYPKYGEAHIVAIDDTKRCMQARLLYLIEESLKGKIFPY